jgi:hypothetical protein
LAKGQTAAVVSQDPDPERAFWDKLRPALIWPRQVIDSPLARAYPGRKGGCPDKSRTTQGPTRAAREGEPCARSLW